MWDRVLMAFNDLLRNAEAGYLIKAKSASHGVPLTTLLMQSLGFNCTDEENDDALKTLRRRAWVALLNKVKEHTADAALLAKLRDAFEERFRYDEAGIPRVWKPEDDIDGVFKKAKDVVSISNVPAARSPRAYTKLFSDIGSDTYICQNCTHRL